MFLVWYINLKPLNVKTNNATPFQSLNLITANHVRWEMCLLNTAYLGVQLLLCEVSSNSWFAIQEMICIVAKLAGIFLLPECHRDMKVIGLQGYEVSVWDMMPCP
jgi:hypothetical protein